MVKLSIVIPVYNTKTYLSRCINSVLKQRIEGMEVICVDDGSTDGASEVLDQYALQDSRVRVIHKENGGSMQARRLGTEEAKGDYIGYVDSDDWIEIGMYETLCHVADQYHADMVSSGYVLEKKMQVKFFDGFSEGIYRDEDLEVLRNQIFFRECSREAGIRPSLCNKLFRTSMMKKIQMAVPDEVSNCEDRICTVAYVLEAESVYILKEAFYHYVFHQDSMSHQEDVYYLDKLGKVYRAFRSLYRHPNFSEKLRIQCEMYMIDKVLEGFNAYMGFSVPDLMWISPEWIKEIPEKSKIVLYGAGRLGKVYYRQIVSDSDHRLQLMGWVDRNYQSLEGYSQKISSPEELRNIEYDYVLLALTDREPAEEARKQIVEELGVEADKILWLKQYEIFWEYAKANGLIEENLKYGIKETDKRKCCQP